MNISKEILKQCNTFLFDCDGVLWDLHNLLQGASAMLAHLSKTRRNFFLITNNSTKSVEQYVNKCQKMGLPVTESNIVCSASVTADYLNSKGAKGPFYVIGQDGIGLELDKRGISHFGIGPDIAPTEDVLKNIVLDPKATGVIVGFDTHFNYRKLMKATSYIAKGRPFYATNEDAQLPGDELTHPGTGSIVAAVKVASGVNPIVMGKPHRPTFEYLCRQHSIDPSRTIMIGDRLDTDIAFGNEFGMHTACVMTGVTDDVLLKQVQSGSDERLKPELTFQSVECILQTLQRTG